MIAWIGIIVVAIAINIKVSESLNSIMNQK